MNISKEARAAIADGVVKLEREFYGRGPSSVRVSVGTGDLSVVTVLSVDSLTAMDRTLVEREEWTAVAQHHRALHRVTMNDFCEMVAGIVGRGPSAYLAQVDPTTGYAVRVFVFDIESEQDETGD
ncbi:MAG: Na-translocating system protein MpsC family protein [Egibacteraceae bacterium]